ncbi:protein CURVATURE THYLAKOID 1A, chloroplastic-like [Pistacia vera]|uniref:protein CURVATURE THYLAKOID 1A, chloroplastic-like n=1 Tax=Pistacia vera TaxID=55513 RepID=UPI001263576B|nr:protein CURVATURE THYLAKOID 1A, chloroplastic-like [Pistacia vera]
MKWCLIIDSPLDFHGDCTVARNCEDSLTLMSPALEIKSLHINFKQQLKSPKVFFTPDQNKSQGSPFFQESPVDASELFTDLKEKWDAVENKSTVILYGGGAIVAVWLSSTIVGAINSIPLLPKIMELVGLGYTGWFVYRYLLFKSSRKELATDIEALKKKIAGTE